jgi:hypothetical protein
MVIRTFTIVDGVFLALLAIAAIGAVPLLQAHGPLTVFIYKDNTVYAEYPLDQDKEVSLVGNTGSMKIRIAEGGVSVLSSNCTRQICVHGGVIRHAFQQLICIPNHILVEIHTNHSKESIDAFSR